MLEKLERRERRERLEMLEMLEIQQAFVTGPPAHQVHTPCLAHENADQTRRPAKPHERTKQRSRTAFHLERFGVAVHYLCRSRLPRVGLRHPVHRIAMLTRDVTGESVPSLCAYPFFEADAAWHSGLV